MNYETLQDIYGENLVSLIAMGLVMNLLPALIVYKLFWNLYSSNF